MSSFRKKKKKKVMLFDLLFSLQNFHEIKKKQKKNRPVLHMLVRSSLSTAEALKKVFDNLMNNVMIKLLKLVLGGSNLFPDRLERHGPVCKRYQVLEKPE